jgi:hypothetical protein
VRWRIFVDINSVCVEGPACDFVKVVIINVVASLHFAVHVFSGNNNLSSAGVHVNLQAHGSRLQVGEGTTTS